LPQEISAWDEITLPQVCCDVPDALVEARRPLARQGSLTRHTFTPLVDPLGDREVIPVQVGLLDEKPPGPLLLFLVPGGVSATVEVEQLVIVHHSSSPSRRTSASIVPAAPTINRSRRMCPYA
jgi:hypothetical protein